jgi:hypothetical protein
VAAVVEAGSLHKGCNSGCAGASPFGFLLDCTDARIKIQNKTLTHRYNIHKGDRMISAHATLVVNVLFSVLLPLVSVLTGQSEKCRDQDLLAVLQPSDKSYSMAMELAQVLRDGDFTIKCVLRSKQEGLFEGLAGAALFRTNRGDFEALFLPSEKTFDRLEVVERQENGWYIYSFAGEPKPWPANRIESPRRIHFFKHSHMLLEISNDVLAKDLSRVVSRR